MTATKFVIHELMTIDFMIYTAPCGIYLRASPLQHPLPPPEPPMEFSHLGSLHKVHIIDRNKEPKHKKTLTECHVYNIMLNQAGVNASSQIIIRLLTWLLEFLTAEPSHFLKVLTL